MKSFRAIFVLLVVICAHALPASASVEVAVGDKLDLYRGHGTLGGEFYVDVLNKGSETSLFDFGTFCVQLSEYVNVSSETGTKYTYEVVGIGLSTMPSGSNSATLGSFAAWLYDMYSSNPAMIATEDMGSTFKNKIGNTLQAGIWLSMGYALPAGFDVYSYANSSLLQQWHNAYLADVTGGLWGPAVSGSAGTDLNLGTFTGDVKIMSLGTRYTSGQYAGEIKTHNQDQLVKIPPPPTGDSPVPEPTSVAVWMLLSVCFGCVTSNRSRNRR